jgi:uncharacterized repeat protein (TIGR01451 family)
MFEKILSVLPYNPGLAHDLAFYGRRMREESSIRRTGLVFIVLTFFVQFFAVIVPPQATVADSTNDLINGGITSAANAAAQCNSNTQHYKDIMANYAISCTDIANGATVTLKSTDANNNLFSFGRLPQGATNSRTGKPTGETPVAIPGVGTLYARHLSSFDSGAFSSYTALKVKTNVTGKYYFILFSCGNLVSVGIPVPYHPPAKPKCPYNVNLFADSPQCFKPCAVNTAIPATSAECFVHCPIPGKTTLPQNSPQCVATCPYNTKILANNANCFPPCQYNSSIPKDSLKCFPPCKYNASLSADSPECFPPCQYNSTVAADSEECKPCDKAVSSSNAIACVSEHKAASNTTRGYSDANNTTAQAGDVIVYTLSAVNEGKAKISTFVFQENISDVLDYADITDYHGGTIGSDNTIIWPAVSIDPGETVTKQVTVTVKAVIPQTPTSTSDQTHFDLNMSNVYGNAINIKVPGSPEKTIEVAATVLPNTGPGTSLMIAAAICIVGGYFYSRSRLLANETVIALQDAAAGGL